VRDDGRGASGGLYQQERLRIKEVLNKSSRWACSNWRIQADRWKQEYKTRLRRPDLQGAAAPAKICSDFTKQKCT